MSIVDIQQNLTLSNVNFGKCLFQYRDKELVLKMFCGIIGQFNSSINVTTDKMSGGDIYECAILLNEWSHDRVEDLILCLKNAKKGLYGKIYNRIDTYIILEFWRAYIEEKAAFMESEYLEIKSQREFCRNETDTKIIQAERNKESFEEKLNRERVASRMKIRQLSDIINENK